MSDEFLVKKNTFFVCLHYNKNNILGAHTKANILPRNLPNAGESQPDVLAVALAQARAPLLNPQVYLSR